MKILMKGNEAIAEAAIRAGCRQFYGYPITPQTEISAYMAKKMPKIGGVFLQAESEVAAINMVFGASSAGARVMTSSSSPGISLKQEGISYLAGARLPAVIVNIVRGGPGLGGIQPAQSDYHQAVRGGGHGDYKLIVLAPNSIQEMADLTMEAFDLADKYRTPVMILGDGMLGQMMEPIEFKEPSSSNINKDWAVTGTNKKRQQNLISSIFIDPDELEKANLLRYEVFKQIEKEEVRVECINTEDADVIIVAYGMTARVASAVAKDMKGVGLIRPVTLSPFPTKIFESLNPKAFLVVEMSLGQMVEDVKLAVNGRKPVHFYGRTGGVVPDTKSIALEIEKIRGGFN